MSPRIVILAAAAIAALPVQAVAQSRHGSTSVQGPHGGGWTAQRSTQAGPGWRSSDRTVTTNDGREASVSRDASWGGGTYNRSTTVTGPNGGTATRDVTRHAPPPPPPRYYGPRAGYYYAPGYGYYPVPTAYYGRVWVTGAVVPVPLRRYYVPAPAVYGLAVAPAGCSWIFVGNRIVLMTNKTGVVVRLGPVFW